MVDGENLVHDKVFVLKKHFWEKILYLLKKMSQLKICFWLIQTTNISKHTSRNKEATMKELMTKLFFFWQKSHLFQKLVAPPKKGYGSKSIHRY